MKFRVPNPSRREQLGIPKSLFQLGSSEKQEVLFSTPCTCLRNKNVPQAPSSYSVYEVLDHLRIELSRVFLLYKMFRKLLPELLLLLLLLSTILCRAAELPGFGFEFFSEFKEMAGLVHGFFDKTLSLHLLIIFTWMFQPHRLCGLLFGCGSQGWEIITWCARFTEQVLNITSESPAVREDFLRKASPAKNRKIWKTLLLISMNPGSSQVVWNHDLTSFPILKKRKKRWRIETWILGGQCSFP